MASSDSGEGLAPLSGGDRHGSGQPGTRVLYVLNGMVNGGAEHGLLTLIERGFFADVDLRVLLFIRGEAGLVRRLETLLGEGRIEVVDAGRRLTPVVLLKSAARLARLVRRHRPDVVVLSLKQANIVGRAVLMAFPAVHVIAFEHIARLEPGRLRPVYEFLLRALSPRVQEVWADCRTTLAATRGYYSGRSRQEAVVPLFVADPNAPAKVAYDLGDPVVLVTAGRVIARKRQADIIDAVRLLGTRGHPVELHIYGDGPDLERLRRHAEGAGVGDRVRFRGYVPDWWREALRGDLFVHASEDEGFCIVAAEAATVGLPSILTPVGGIADYTEDGTNAVHVPVGDVEAIAGAVERLMADAGTRERLGRAAAASMRERFGPSVMATFEDRRHGSRNRPLRDEPRLSVVMTCYNEGAYIGEAVASVLGQTRQDLIDRIVIADDGSNDETRGVLADIETWDPRIRVLYGPGGDGISGRRNAAVETIETTWFAILDGDDIWTPDRIERTIGATADEEVVLIYADYHVFRDGDRDRKDAFRAGAIDITRQEDLVRAYFLIDPPIVPSTTLVRTSAFRRIGGFDTRVRVFEDTDFCNRLARTGRFAYVAEPVLHKRSRPDSLSAVRHDLMAHHAFVAFRAAAAEPRLLPLVPRRLSERARKLGNQMLLGDDRASALLMQRTAVGLDRFSGKAWLSLVLTTLAPGVVVRMMKRKEARRRSQAPGVQAGGDRPLGLAGSDDA